MQSWCHNVSPPRETGGGFCKWRAIRAREIYFQLAARAHRRSGLATVSSITILSGVTALIHKGLDARLSKGHEPVGQTKPVARH